MSMKDFEHGLIVARIMDRQAVRGALQQLLQGVMSEHTIESFLAHAMPFQAAEASVGQVENAEDLIMHLVDDATMRAIERMSLDELRAELLEEGVDVESVAERTRRLLLEVFDKAGKDG